MRKDSRGKELILQVGGAGFRKTLYGMEKIRGNWTFFIESDQGTMNDFLLPEDQFSLELLTSRSEPINTWEEAEKLIERSEFHRSYPVKVHPDFRAKVWRFIERRIFAVSDNIREYYLKAWMRLCGLSYTDSKEIYNERNASVEVLKRPRATGKK